jgi:hypothetical protein
MYCIMTYSTSYCHLTYGSMECNKDVCMKDVGTDHSLKVPTCSGLQWHTIHTNSLRVYNNAINNRIRELTGHEAC